MPPSRPRLPLLLVATTALALAGPARAERDPADPWEPMNRTFFNLQEGLDKGFIARIAHGFGRAPLPFRAGLINFGHNLGEPTTFVNDVLQARPAAAARTLTRFLVNSTIGIGGLFDVAGHNHLPRHENGFGTTLGRWGFKPGPYLFLPLIGPSTFRDTLGDVGDIWVNPLTYSRYPHKAVIGITTSIVDGLGKRVESDQDLETIRATSTDPYASLRSFYLQNRQAEITGKAVTIENLPDFDEPAPGAKPGTPPAPKPDATPPPETPKPTPQASACAPAAERWAEADLPYATWRGG